MWRRADEVTRRSDWAHTVHASWPKRASTSPSSASSFDRVAEEERLRSWLTNKYVRLKWADPEWAAALTASRERASKAAASKVAAPGARGRKRVRKCAKEPREGAKRA